MKNQVDRLRIRHFKSIEDLDIRPSRINVFIGEPNVGKSNILEAIGLLGFAYGLEGINDDVLKSYVRYEEPSNLFYDDKTETEFEIITNQVMAIGKLFSHHGNPFIFSTFPNTPQFPDIYDAIKDSNNSSDCINLVSAALDNFANKKIVADFYPLVYSIPASFSNNQNHFLQFKNNSPFKRYDFKKTSDISNKFPSFLIPPNGPNLFQIVKRDQDLSLEIKYIFESYGLKFRFDEKKSNFTIVKEKGLSDFTTPYSSMADTLQRLVFYFAAIDSNANSVLILEEPEVHSFPPYTRNLAERIVNADQNQFFIATHSPYMLEALMEKANEEDLSIWLTYYENHETKVKLIPHQLLKNLQTFNYDIFFNLDQLLEEVSA